MATPRHPERDAVILVDTNGEEYSASSPLPAKITDGVETALVDASGNLMVNVAVGGGGGTQYTEADTDASITGTAMLMEGAANTLLPVQGTVADGLLVNLGANNDVTVTGSVTANAGTNLNTSLLATAAKQDTLLTELQLKADLTETQPVSLASLPALVTGSATIGAVTGPTADNAANPTLKLGVLPAVALAAAPTRTEGNVNPLRLNLAGDVAVTLDAEAVVLGAGTAEIGKLAAGLANIGDVDVASIAAGDNNIGNVDIVSGVITTVSTVTAVTAITNALPAGTNAIGKLAANSGVDIGDVDVTSIAAGTNLIGDVGIQPRTTNGLTTFMASGSDGSSILVATAQAIKASAGKLYGYYAFNPENAVTFVHFYNTAAASVTVGTTAPLFTLAIPAGAAANLMSDIGITFSNAGWSCAATTTAGGLTAPATGVSLMAWYA